VKEKKKKCCRRKKSSNISANEEGSVTDIAPNRVSLLVELMHLALLEETLLESTLLGSSATVPRLVNNVQLANIHSQNTTATFSYITG